nr:ABC transporter ATP-binding protein [uncultured Gemmiger sp.]
MLTIDHLTKTYPGGKTAVRDLSLHVVPGDIYGFIGHNGAGKTTTIKAAVGLLEFEEGDIRINGVSIRQDPLTCKRTFAYIPDDPLLYPYLTGQQYLDFVADVFEVARADRTQRTEELARRFGLTDVLGNLISSYSHGMKQKLAILGALVHAPRLLILDEPFVGLDPEAVVTLKELMHELCRQGGAVFFSTHVLDVAERLCNKVAIIRQGQLVAAGETAALTGGKTLEETFMEVVRHGETDNTAGNRPASET